MHLSNNTLRLLLQVRKHNRENSFVFKGLEDLDIKIIKLVEDEVVNFELQVLLLNVARTRKYTLKEIEYIIKLVRNYDPTLQQRILKLILESRLHVELLYKLKKFAS